MEKKLSIITINRNNADGLRKTIESVLNQTSESFEYIVVDGNSTDGSVDLIKQYENSSLEHFSWISESDSGIYNAMNKGIRMAKGEYVQFLNSGDFLASNDVTEKMLAYLFPSPQGEGLEVRSSILYGNMLKPFPKRIHRDKGFAGRQPTMLDFYTGTLNHSPAYIKRTLFDNYGLYDESLRIVSDWKWYLNVIALHGVIPVYRDIDVTVFDMNGISTLNASLDKEERLQVFSGILPVSVLKDYESWSFPIEQMMRINRYWIIRKMFWFLERLLFKWEKYCKINR
jgi:glycosyltransferase involved in cell wall biosynthesis